MSKRELDHEVRLAVLEERWRCERRALKVRTTYLERRLADLNGEAGRLKQITENSVSSEKFNDYVNSQRDRQDAAEKAARDQFSAYVETQAKALAAINVKLATWGGALIAAGAIVQYLLRHT